MVYLTNSQYVSAGNKALISTVTISVCRSQQQFVIGQCNRPNVNGHISRTFGVCQCYVSVRDIELTCVYLIWLSCHSATRIIVRPMYLKIENYLFVISYTAEKLRSDIHTWQVNLYSIKPVLPICYTVIYLNYT